MAHTSVIIIEDFQSFLTNFSAWRNLSVLSYSFIQTKQKAQNIWLENIAL